MNAIIRSNSNPVNDVTIPMSKLINDIEKVITT